MVKLCDYKTIHHYLKLLNVYAERRGEERVNAPVIHSVDPGLTDQQTGLLELELLCQGWSFTSCLGPASSYSLLSY